MKIIPPFRILDPLRGLASLWVVMAHASTPFLAGNGGAAMARSNPVYFVSSYGALGVVVFFVISGYCVTGALYNSMLRGSGVSGFLHARFRRIYPPYLATCLLAVAISFVLSFLQRHHLAPTSNHDVPIHRDLLYWVSNLTLTQIEFKRSCLVFVFWSLCYEAVFYAIMGLLFAGALALIRRGINKETNFIPILTSGVLLVSLASLTWLLADPKGCLFPLDLWYQFGLGSLLFLHDAARDSDESCRIIRADWALALTAAFTILFAVRHDLSSLNGMLVESPVFAHPSSRVKSVLCLLLVGFLMLARKHDDTILRFSLLRPLASLGIFSYSLYLTHPLFLPFVDAGLRRLGVDHQWYLLNYATQIAVAIVASFVFYRLVERHFISRRISPRSGLS